MSHLPASGSGQPCCCLLSRRSLAVLTAIVALVVAVPTILSTVAGAQDDKLPPKPNEEGWITIFDGKTFNGWKINENEESWSIKDGAFVANGERSHLFYMGDLQPMKNFELKVDVMTRKGSNGGIYFHTKYQDSGWPEQGYESQVNQTHGDPQKTGGLYNTVRVLEAPAKDDEWYTQHIIVNDKHVTVKINDKVVVDYEEPADKEGTVKLSEGTIAFQSHDPGSTVYFKNVRLKILD